MLKSNRTTMMLLITLISGLVFLNENLCGTNEIQQRKRGKDILYYPEKKLLPEEKEKIKNFIIEIGSEFWGHAVSYRASDETIKKEEELRSYDKFVFPVYLEVLEEQLNRLKKEGNKDISEEQFRKWKKEKYFLSLTYLDTAIENIAYNMTKGNATRIVIDSSMTIDENFAALKQWQLWWEANKHRDMLLPDGEQRFANVRACLWDYFNGTSEERKSAAEDLDILGEKVLPYIGTITGNEKDEKFRAKLTNHLYKLTGYRIEPYREKVKVEERPSVKWGQWWDKNKNNLKWNSHVEMLEKELKEKK